MDAFDSLPSRPLRRADIERLRARGTVAGFIELESRAYAAENGGLKRAVALAERTIVGLAFEAGTWQRTILARDADKHRHLEETLKQVAGTDDD